MVEILKPSNDKIRKVLGCFGLWEQTLEDGFALRAQNYMSEE